MRAVLFDLDDTLYAYAPSHRAGLAAAAAALGRGGDLAGFEADYAAARTAAFARLGPVAAAHSRHLYFQALVRDRRGRDAPAETLEVAAAYWDAALAAMTPAPGAAELLDRLRARGVRLGVLTDLTVEIQLRKLCRLGLADAFEAVVTSEEAGRDKPDGAGFARALSLLGAAPRDAVMVGDNPVNDIEGALAAGLGAVFVGPAAPPSLPAAARRVAALAELLEPPWGEVIGWA